MNMTAVFDSFVWATSGYEESEASEQTQNEKFWQTVEFEPTA